MLGPRPRETAAQRRAKKQIERRRIQNENAFHKAGLNSISSDTIRRRTATNRTAAAAPRKGSNATFSATKAFNSLDTNGNGIISANELIVGLLDRGVDLDHIRQLFGNLDTNNDEMVRSTPAHIWLCCCITTPSDCIFSPRAAALGKRLATSTNSGCLCRC